MQEGERAAIAAIFNAGWMVRHYASKRTSFYREQRARAIRRMGLAVRAAFTRSEDFEPLLAAVLDALRPRDERPF